MQEEIKQQRLEFPVADNFSPEITIEVIGLSGESRKVVAIVDTGFTGFLQIPLAIGISCNLALWSISTSILADGSRVRNLQCFGKIRFGNKELANILTLSDTGNDCLLGVQFLQELKGEFILSHAEKKAIFCFPEVEQLKDGPKDKTAESGTKSKKEKKK